MQGFAKGRRAGLVVAFAAVAAHGGAAERPRLVLVDFVGVPALTAESLTGETRAVLDAVAAPVWRHASPGEAYAADEIPVVLLHRARPATGRLVLGSARARAARPAAWVFVEAVLEALDLPGPVETLSGPEARELGLALGRVAVHELVHALAPARGHAAAGLMVGHLHSSALTGARPRLDAASAGRLRAGLDDWRLRWSSRPSEPSTRRAEAGQTAEAGPR